MIARDRSKLAAFVMDDPWGEGPEPDRREEGGISVASVNAVRMDAARQATGDPVEERCTTKR
jgi:hypothetical protein